MRTVPTLLALLAIPLILQGEEQAGQPASLSPDRKWEYRATDEKAVLMRAGSDEQVLDLGDEIGEPASKTGQLVWAADSRRFAFNSRKGGKYYGCDLYELAEARWKKLPGLEHNNGVGQIVERALRKAVKRLGAKQDEMNTVMTQWRVRRWIDNDTFEAYVGDARRVASKKDPDDWDYFGCALLFRGKCDNRAGWKAASIRQLSDAEDEKIQKEDE